MQKKLRQHYVVDKSVPTCCGGCMHVSLLYAPLHLCSSPTQMHQENARLTESHAVTATSLMDEMYE